MRTWSLLLAFLVLAVLPSTASAAYTVSAVWGGPTSDLFETPADLAVDPAGNVYVADPDRGQVVKLSPSGEQLLAFASAPGGLDGPYRVAVVTTGDVFVVDRTGEAHRFAADGAFKIAFPCWGSPSGDNTDIAVSPDGTLLVTGTALVDPKSDGVMLVEGYKKCGVREYSRDGALLREFVVGSTWYALDNDPILRLDVTPDGSVLVAYDVKDRDDDTVTQYAPDGTKAGGFSLGGGSRLEGVAVGVANDLFVTVTPIGDGPGGIVANSSAAVRHYDRDGTLIESYTSLGSLGNGTFFDLGGPAVDRAGNLYVGDGYDDRVVRFSPVPVTPTVIVTPAPTATPGSSTHFGQRRYVVGAVPSNPPTGTSIGTAGRVSSGSRTTTGVGTGVARGVTPPNGRFVRWSPVDRWRAGRG